MALKFSRLQGLSTELLDEISAYLPQHSLLRLLSVCKLLQPVAARQLYRSVEVCNMNAIKCFTTLGSKEATLPYGNYIRSIAFILTNGLYDCELYDYPFYFLCKALFHTPSLTALSLNIDTKCSLRLLVQMKNSAIVRTIHDYNDRNDPDAIPDPILNLNQLSISGDLSFFQLACFRSITILKVDTISKFSDIEEMVECLKEGSSTISLINLSMFLDFENTIEIIKSLRTIGQAMYAIEYLRIDSDNIEAQVNYSFLVSKQY